MKKKTEFSAARDLLLQYVSPVGKEKIPLSECGGRILGEPVYARANVPAFDRSPYDGYAFRAGDTQGAAPDHPVVLRIVEEIPAGAVPTVEITSGTAAKILTGAPIPVGADAVFPYERTQFTETTVSISCRVESGSNIVKMGEDVHQGALLAREGMVIDAGLAGTLAAQGISMSVVYQCPTVGILSTGNEVAAVDLPDPLPQGKVRDSNRYALMALVRQMGCRPCDLGQAGDDAEEICRKLAEGLENCDMILTTGGVSVGDYDLTPRAMELAGTKLFVQGVALKPGMACAYGKREGKLICGLSGNPASALTNFYVVVAPAIRKLCGMTDVLPKEFPVTLAEDFPKKSPCTRLLRGTLDFSDGRICLRISRRQGNVVLSSAVGCNAMAIVPAGSGPVAAGTVLKGFLI